jgi:hypothetical protein
MPSPEIEKEIIDAGAYVFGTKALAAVLCVTGTVPLMQAKHGLAPDPRLGRQYLAAAEKAEEAAEALAEAGAALVADLVARAASSGHGA